jgi:hypothetical protein
VAPPPLNRPAAAREFPLKSHRIDRSREGRRLFGDAGHQPPPDATGTPPAEVGCKNN